MNNSWVPLNKKQRKMKYTEYPVEEKVNRMCSWLATEIFHGRKSPEAPSLDCKRTMMFEMLREKSVDSFVFLTSSVGSSTNSR